MSSDQISPISPMHIHAHAHAQLHTDTPRPFLEKVILNTALNLTLKPDPIIHFLCMCVFVDSVGGCTWLHAPAMQPQVAEALLLPGPGGPLPSSGQRRRGGAGQALRRSRPLLARTPVPAAASAGPLSAPHQSGPRMPWQRRGDMAQTQGHLPPHPLPDVQPNPNPDFHPNLYP